MPNIHYGPDQVQYEFSIAVYMEGGQPHIISRFERDFERLQKDMGRVLHHSQDAAIPQPTQNGHGSRIVEGEHKVKMYEEYLIKLTKSTDFYV